MPMIALGLGGTTGKISGKIINSDNGDPLPGANIMVLDTYLGAAADGDGQFMIINVPPGIYSIMVQMIGYESKKITDVTVSVNRTTSLDIDLAPTMLEGQMVVVQAERIAERKDQTGTIKNVSADQIGILPVENIDAVVQMQAGIVAGHFRGGRDTEVTYLIDGVAVDEAYDGTSAAVDVEADAVQDLEVITGTFNAEYGNAMSGVVNAVTKDGGNEFHGSYSIGLGNYFTGNDDVFIGLKPHDYDRNQDYKFQLSGPVIKDNVTFFINWRKQSNKNHLNGIRLFNPWDYSNFHSTNPAEWIFNYSGDLAYIPMEWDENESRMAKLTFNIIKNIKFSLMYTLNDDIWRDYNHSFKYNPDGRNSSYRTTHFYTASLNHMITEKLFYEFKTSYIDNNGGWYLYEDPLDDRYLNDIYLDSYGSGFNTGGQEAQFDRTGEFQGKGHSRRRSEEWNYKFDITWQANTIHSFKTGFDFTRHTLDNEWHLIRNAFAGTDSSGFAYEPEIFYSGTEYADVYVMKPEALALYIQDKMEFDDMVINFGLRYDQYDPKTKYPSDRRNPANLLNRPEEEMSDYLDADVKSQISPRFGLAYQLGNAAVLHFSYGHFFQTPPMYSFYDNGYHEHEGEWEGFFVSSKDFVTTHGNSQLDAQKTVSYEVGLWQELAQGMGLEVALFYRDIYDLLSTKVVTTYNQVEYGLYTNKDYGNVRGLEVKLDYHYSNLAAYLNYTLQYTRGNADSPTQAFDRAGNNQDPVNKLYTMPWDQRHTLNATLGYNTPTYGASITGYFNSGTTYTYGPPGDSRLSRINLGPNNDYKPAGYYADFTGYTHIKINDRFGLKLGLNIYNVFDRKNEVDVNGNTGRAYSSLVTEQDVESHQSSYNAYEDTYQNPSMYSAPRMVKFSMSVTF